MFASIAMRLAFYAVGIAILGAIVFFIYDKGRNDANSVWQTKWDKQVAILAAEAAKSQIENLEKEADWLKQLNKVRDDAKITADRIATDLANSNDSADKLRNQVARLAAAARKECGSARVTQGSNTAGASINMLADLSTGLDKVSRELAEFADRSRIAGIACQNSFGVIKNPH